MYLTLWLYASMYAYPPLCILSRQISYDFYNTNCNTNTSNNDINNNNGYSHLLVSLPDYQSLTNKSKLLNQSANTFAQQLKQLPGISGPIALSISNTYPTLYNMIDNIQTCDISKQLFVVSISQYSYFVYVNMCCCCCD